VTGGNHQGKSPGRNYLGKLSGGDYRGKFTGGKSPGGENHLLQLKQPIRNEAKGKDVTICK